MTPVAKYTACNRKMNARFEAEEALDGETDKPYQSEGGVMVIGKRFKPGQRWRSKFNGDVFVIDTIWREQDLMHVIWDSNKDYLADVWAWDVRPLQLARVL